MPDLMDGFNDPYFSEQPDYINTAMPVHNYTTTGGQKLLMDGLMLKENQVNVIGCSGQTLTIGDDVIIENLVLITDCKVKFSQGSALENAYLIVDNFDDRMKSMAPRAAFTVPNTLTGEGNMVVDITFESMDDFSQHLKSCRVLLAKGGGYESATTCHQKRFGP